MDLLGTLKRTHYCGEVNTADIDKEVVVMGWVNRRRDHGGLIFIDLRDIKGLVQVVFDQKIGSDAFAKAEKVFYVIATPICFPAFTQGELVTMLTHHQQPERTLKYLFISFIKHSSANQCERMLVHGILTGTSHQQVGPAF